MRVKPRIYIETTVFNYYFLEDSERKADISATKELFQEIEGEIFDPYISALVIGELEKCPDASRRKKMLKLIEKFAISELTFKDYKECESLAGKYILAGAIPAKKKGDALHIAMATIAGMDILTSWNCDHIVRFKTQQIVRTINIIEGYGELAINTPREVIRS